MVAVTVLAGLTWSVYQSRERPSARPFIAFAAGITLWAAFELGTELPVVSQGLLSPVWSLGQVAVGLALPGVWVVYALGYAGRGTGLTRRRIAMLVGIAVPPLVAVAIFVTASGRAVAEPAIASLIAFELFNLFVLFLYGLYLLVAISRSRERVTSAQVVVLTAGFAAPYVVGSAGPGGSPINGVSLGLVLSGVLLWGATRRYPVLTGFPKADYVARTRVVEALEEAVFVLDWENHILDANAAAARLFDRDPAAMVGDPVGSVASGLTGVDLSAGVGGLTTLETTRGQRQFQYSVSPVAGTDANEGDDGGAIARTVLLRDVTSRQTREQRLTVLNRILRHNVRNELDVVLAHADRIDEDRLRESITASATDLVSLSEKAREAERLMTASTEAPSEVNLASVASDVVDEYSAAYPESDVSLSAPEELVLSTHRGVVERLLSELVENALVHAGPAAAVVVALEQTAEDAVELSVVDDGPGIPDHERQLLADGTETQLEHGRGIGLWLVSWAVTRLGGNLTFDDKDPTGSVVTVRLPNQRRPSTRDEQ